jgi:hypothetical protein
LLLQIEVAVLKATEEKNWQFASNLLAFVATVTSLAELGKVFNWW